MKALDVLGLEWLDSKRESHCSFGERISSEINEMESSSPCLRLRSVLYFLVTSSSTSAKTTLDVWFDEPFRSSPRSCVLPACTSIEESTHRLTLTTIFREREIAR